MFFKRKPKPDEKDDAKEQEAPALPNDPAVAQAEPKEADAGKAVKAAEPKVKRDLRKAATFFRHAATVSEARNYDYAIDLFINGLRHDPDNMNMHESLREVALRRKVAGGKPAGMREKINLGAKDKIDKFLHAEKLWAKEPLSYTRAIAAMEKAIEADDDQEDFNLGEVAGWIGVLIFDKNEIDKQLNKDDFIKLRDLFSLVGMWDKARDACARAIDLAPDDLNLAGELKDLEAEVTMAASYGAEKPEELDFRKNIKDSEKQHALDQEDQLTKSDQAILEIIQRKRADFEQNPDDLPAREALVKALLQKHSSDTENEAIALLQQAHERTQNYRYKMEIADVQMRQMERKLRKLQALAKQRPDEAVKKQLKEFYRQKLKFELSQYVERAKQYPTENRWRYEIGKCFFAAKQYEQAVEHFQRAVSDPKFRVNAANFLGQCYLQQEWFDEAIDTLKSGLEALRDPNDRGVLDMKYHLMDALFRSARNEKNADRAKEASKVASEILQTDINFRDIKTKVNEIRQLTKELAGV